MKLLKTLGFTLSLLLTAAPLVNAQSTVGVQGYQASSQGFSQNAPSGFTFESSAPISVSSLGILNYLFTLNTSGGVADTLTVGLWSLNGNLLASTTITPTTPVMTLDNSSFVAINPVTLFAGQYYIAAVFDDNTANDNILVIDASAPPVNQSDFVTLGSGLTLGGLATGGPGLTFSPGQAATTGGAASVGANFEFGMGVPEPRTITLLVIAAAFFAVKFALTVNRRRRRAAYDQAEAAKS